MYLPLKAGPNNSFSSTSLLCTHPSSLSSLSDLSLFWKTAEKPGFLYALWWVMFVGNYTQHLKIRFSHCPASCKSSTLIWAQAVDGNSTARQLHQWTSHKNNTDTLLQMCSHFCKYNVGLYIHIHSRLTFGTNSAIQLPKDKHQWDKHLQFTRTFHLTNLHANC